MLTSKITSTHSTPIHNSSEKNKKQCMRSENSLGKGEDAEKEVEEWNGAARCKERKEMRKVWPCEERQICNREGKMSEESL